MSVQAADRLTMLSELAGVEKSELAELLGVSYEAVRLWFAGDFVPNGKNLARLATLFGVSLDYLMRGDGKRPTKRAVKRAVRRYRAEHAARGRTEAGAA